MASILNEEQFNYWDGEAGAIWVEHQQQLDQLLTPFTDDSIASLGSIEGRRVLDLGCGCGDSSIKLAAAGAQVLGIDLSRPMLAQANHRVQNSANPTFLHADGAVFNSEHEFDVLYSRFGSMFFKDPVDAFTNLKEALCRGGEIRLVCWQAPSLNPWMSVGGRAIASFVPEMEAPRDPRAPGPFAFSDPDYVRSILASSGFTDVSLTPVTQSLRVAADLETAVAFQLVIGPAARAFKTLPKDSVKMATQALKDALAPFETSTGVVMEGAVWLVSGKT